MSPSKNWYAVLTADVLYSKNLTSRQKLLVAVVANLANEKGYCFASNSHFADMMQCSVRSIQRDLDVLEAEGFLGRVVKLKHNGEVEFRILTPMTPASLVVTPVTGGGDTDDTGGGVTDVTYNNKDYLITNSKSEEHAHEDSDASINCKKEEASSPQSPPSPNPKFKKPTLEELKEYANKQGYTWDVGHFYDYYESNGWKVGKSQMKSWESAMRNWDRNEKKFNSNSLKTVHKKQGSTFNQHLSQAERLKNSGVI